jgi:hypothetical protein
MSGHRRGHGARDTLLVAVLVVFAVLSAVAWLALHLVVLPGVALLIGLAFHGGRPHVRRHARPGQVISPRQGQVHAAGPAAAQASPAATMAVAGYRDEGGTRQQPSLQATSGKARLLADPRSGIRPLSQLRGS